MMSQLPSFRCGQVLDQNDLQTQPMKRLSLSWLRDGP